LDELPRDVSGGRLLNGDRHRARELVVKVLFERDVARSDPHGALRYQAAEEAVPEGDRRLAEEMLDGVLAQLPAIDQRIAGTARDWRLPRLAAIDRNILRLAVWELCFERRTPVGVCIAEAVALADRYGGEDSPRFVNGVLGQLARELGLGGES